jgi:hypothetical protein
MNHELESAWKKSVVALPRYYPEVFLKGGRKPQQTSEYLVSRPRFERGAFQIEIYSVPVA